MTAAWLGGLRCGGASRKGDYKILRRAIVMRERVRIYGSYMVQMALC